MSLLGSGPPPTGRANVLDPFRNRCNERIGRLGAFGEWVAERQDVRFVRVWGIPQREVAPPIDIVDQRPLTRFSNFAMAVDILEDHAFFVAVHRAFAEASVDAAPVDQLVDPRFRHRPDDAPARGDRSAQLTIATPNGERTAYVNPHDGRLLGTTAPGGVMGFVKRLHSLDLAGPVMNALVEIVNAEGVAAFMEKRTPVFKGA